jgi:hypothetical protein
VKHFAIDAVIAIEARLTAPMLKQIPSTRNKPNSGDSEMMVTNVRATTATLGNAHMTPSQTQNTVTSTNSVRRLNLNQRRFGLVSVMAVPNAAGRG